MRPIHQLVHPWQRVSDEDYIERVRRSLAKLDRYRGWIVALFVTLAAALVWMVVNAFNLINALAWLFQPANNPGAGRDAITLGMVFGIGLGLLWAKIAIGLLSALASHRTERLLLRYYEAIRAAQSGAEEIGSAT